MKAYTSKIVCPRGNFTGCTFSGTKGTKLYFSTVGAVWDSVIKGTDFAPLPSF